MTRGQNNGTSFDFAIAHLHGRVEQQIQQFAAEIGVSANWIAERLATLLSPQRERILNHLPSVQREAAGVHRRVEPLALAVNAHSSETQPPAKAKRRRGDTKAYWGAMTQEQRTAEMRRRLEVGIARKAAAEKAAKKAAKKAARAAAPAKAPVKAAKKKFNTQSLLSPEQKAVKQRAYQARANARKRGESLPPLPPPTSQMMTQ